MWLLGVLSPVSGSPGSKQAPVVEPFLLVDNTIVKTSVLCGNHFNNSKFNAFNIIDHL